MGDHLIYEDAISTELYTSSEFVKKQWLFVNDNNQGNYASQIVLDTTSLSNSGAWMGWSESFILMPLVLQFETATTQTTTAVPGTGNINIFNTVMTADACYDWVVGLKNGYWQMMHSLTVEFNNRNVVQQVPFLNVYCSFRNLTSWSKADLENWGQLCGFYPDTADSWLFNNKPNNTAIETNNVLGSSGIGISNNRNCEYVSISNFNDVYASGSTNATNGAGNATSGAIPSSFNFTTRCTVPNASVRMLFNKGLQIRQSWLNYSTVAPTDADLGNFLPPLEYEQATANGAPNTPIGRVGSFTIQSASANQAILLNPTASAQTFQANISSPSDNSRAITIPAIIRLKDVCNFFEKVPLLKGSTMRLYINTNQCFFTAQYINGQLLATTPVAGTVGSITEGPFSAVGITVAPQILGGGGTNPIMLASNDLGQGGYNCSPYNLANSAPTADNLQNNLANYIPPNVMTVKVGVSIAKCQFQSQFPSSGTQACIIQQCRLYCPAYTLSPIAEQQLLSLSPTKEILYEDIFQYSFSQQSGTFNILVSNGVPNIKQVIVIPFLSATSNGVSTQYTGVFSSTNNITPVGMPMLSTSTLLSPFATSGATPDPITIQNFQILISGTTLFQAPTIYGFEEFYEQVVSINQLNGSLTTGLGSGLIGYDQWQHLYRYYVGDASRILPSEEGMARSVQIQGTLPYAQGGQLVDIMVFIVYEKKITVNVSTGQEIV
jgi:hypothetical protein